MKFQDNNRNTADYYAYGLPISDSEISSRDPYLYGNKMLYTFNGVNLYDFEARTYAPDIARFMQPDSKADDYHGISPYTYCLGDPINFIDPNGEKVYYVDMTGHLITSEEVLNNISDRNTYETEFKGYDCILIIDNDGKVFSKSSLFKEGTIILHDNSKSDLNGKDVTLFEIKSDKASASIFETLSNNITAKNGIEFGHVIRGTKPTDANNVVFTGHTKAKLPEFMGVMKHLFKQKIRFREVNHSHYLNDEPSSGDKRAKEWLNSAIINKKHIPKHKIYVSNTKTYVEY